MSDTDVVLFDMSDDDGEGHVVSEEGEATAVSPSAITTTTTTTTTTTVVTTTTTTAVVAPPTTDKPEEAAAAGSDDVTPIEPNEADGGGGDGKAEPGGDDAAAPNAEVEAAEQTPAEQAPGASGAPSTLVVDDKYTKTWEPNSDWSSRWEKMTKIPPKTEAGRLRIESARKGLRDPTGLQPARITSGRSRITRSARGRPNAQAASSLGRSSRAAAAPVEAIPEGEGEAAEGESSPHQLLMQQGDGGPTQDDQQRQLSPAAEEPMAVPYVERQLEDDQQGRPSDANLPMSIPEGPAEQQDQAHEEAASAAATKEEGQQSDGHEAAAADAGDGSEQEQIAMLSSIPDEEPPAAAADAAADNGDGGAVDAPAEPSASAVGDVGRVDAADGASLGGAVEVEAPLDSRTSAGGGAKPKRKVVWNKEQLGEQD